MALTYMGLVNECLGRLNEVPLTSSNFSTATGFHNDVKNSVNTAVNDIHMTEYYWPFNHTTATLTITAGDQTYDTAADMNVVDWDSFYIEDDAANSITAANLEYIDWDEYVRLYRERDKQATSANEYGKPEFVTRDYDDNIVISPKPDNSNYRITYDYWQIPTDMSAFDDTTRIPDRFKNVILAGAMHYSYGFRDNVEQAALEWKKFTDGIGRMRSILINRYNKMKSTKLRGRG